MCKKCEESGLKRGDILRVDQVVDPVMNEWHHIKEGMHGLVMPNDEYFAFTPEGVLGDTTHLCVVFENQEVGVERAVGVLPFMDGKLRWSKVGNKPLLVL